MKKLMYRAALAALVSGSAAAQAPQRPTTPPATPQSAPESTPPEDKGDVVIVTARIVEEQVQDVPAAVTGLSSDQLRDAGGIKDIKDLSYLLPGLAFVDTGNINAENNIRGAGAGTARTAGVDSPIAVLRDGASITGGTIGGRTFARQDLFDVQRIEVTRGPQGALYGVNAVGGVMQAVSKRPDSEPGGSVSLTYSPEIERYQVDAIANMPISDTLGARLGIQMADKDKGFFFNTSTGKYSDIEEYFGFKGSLEWQPTDDLNFYFVADASEDKGASNLIRSVNVRNDPTELPTAVGPADIDGPFVHSMNGSNQTDRSIQSYNGQVEWETALGKLTAITLYRDRDTIFRQDADQSAPGYATPPFPAATCATRLCTTNFLDKTLLKTQDIRLANDFGDNVSWMIGANIGRRESQFATVVDGRTTSAANTAPSPAANLSSTAKENEDQTGAFGSVDWRVTDELTLDGAVRWNHSEKDTDAYTIVRGAPAANCALAYVNPFSAPTLFPTCLRTRNILTETFDTTAPSISAKYEFTDHFRMFASAGIGYRAGGFNANSVLDPAITPTYDPEKNTAYEVGAKFELWDAFFTVTAFQNQFDDLLVTIETVGPDAVTRNSRFNAGQATTEGVDFEVFGLARLPSDWGSIDYNGAVNYLTGEIESGPYNGRTVEGSPEWTYTGTLTYRKRVWDNWRFVTSASYRGQRGGFTNTTKINNQVDMADIDIFNGSIGIENPNMRLTLEARNLTDETYITLRDPLRSVYGDPREIRLSLTFLFGSEERNFRGR